MCVAVLDMCKQISFMCIAVFCSILQSNAMDLSTRSNVGYKIYCLMRQIIEKGRRVKAVLKTSFYRTNV